MEVCKRGQLGVLLLWVAAQAFAADCATLP